MGHFGAAYLLPKICYTYPEWWTWHRHIVPKENLKGIDKINHVTHPLISDDISIFSVEISTFCYIRKYG